MNQDFLKNVSKLQMELKAPKNQENSFGGYKYRSCEDILEAAKPIAAKYGIIILLSDNVEVYGNRFYIKATATLLDIATGEKLETTAFARETETKKKSDDAQVTGSASSYARKYALNGLLCIDDAKDADTDSYRKEEMANSDMPYAGNVQPAVQQVICPCCGEVAGDVKSNGRNISAAIFVGKYNMCGACYERKRNGGNGYVQQSYFNGQAYP